MSKNLIDQLFKNQYNDSKSGLEGSEYNKLVETFNRCGFDFYIDRASLKFDSKIDFLGGGGYGKVFKAQWMGTTVAVKWFEKRCTGKKSITDFIKEIEIVNQVRHPNIIFYMGISFDEDHHYCMITEYAAKGSLFDLLHSGTPERLDDEKIFKIIRELASALQYLHSRGILHCDLKSQNILLKEDWKVKICDFGLARYLSLIHI